MNRLQKQIAEEKQKLSNLINFSNQQMEKFNALLPSIKNILKSYKVFTINTDNCYVEKFITSDEFVLRMVLKVNLENLSERRLKNLEKRLRDIGVPMPCAPISKDSISMCFYEK